jgi:hypothetical protein
MMSGLPRASGGFGKLDQLTRPWDLLDGASVYKDKVVLRRSRPIWQQALNEVVGRPSGTSN